MSRYFPNLFGNERTKERLGAAIDSNTLPHAFLISGPDGSGKRTLANEICAALNCEKKGDSNATLPCNRCNTCRRIAEGKFTDIRVLARAKEKMAVGVEEVRLFRADMFLSSTESPYKLYVIEDAERMTVNAQNALLKVLEEPPANVIILLLTTSDDAILTTIKSRTQYIAMQLFTEEQIANFLSSLRPDKDILMCAHGCIGRAKELVGAGAEDVKAGRRVTQNIIVALKQSTSYSTLYNAIKELPTKRDALSEALEELTIALRDLILLKFDDNAPLTFYSSRESAQDIAAGVSSKRLLAIYDIIKSVLSDIAKNVNTAAIIASLGARIKLI